MGVEANIPFGKMNIKAEATITDDFYGLDYSTKTNEGIIRTILTLMMAMIPYQFINPFLH